MDGPPAPRRARHGRLLRETVGADLPRLRRNRHLVRTPFLPVGYEEARIGVALAERMRAWEAEFDRDFAPDLEWSTPDGEARHLAEGLRLARALSDELGDAFVVEVDDVDNAGNEVLRRMRGLGPGTNPEAIAAFEGWWVQQREEAARWRAAGTGGSFVPVRSAPLAAHRRDERHSH